MTMNDARRMVEAAYGAEEPSGWVNMVGKRVRCGLVEGVVVVDAAGYDCLIVKTEHGLERWDKDEVSV